MNATTHTPTGKSWTENADSIDALTARVAELEAALDALSLAAYGAVNAPGVAKYAEAFESAQVNARAALKGAA